MKANIPSLFYIYILIWYVCVSSIRWYLDGARSYCRIELCSALPGMKREFFLMKIEVSMLGLVVTIVDGLKVFLSDDFNSRYREGCHIVHEQIKFQVLNC